MAFQLRKSGSAALIGFISLVATQGALADPIFDIGGSFTVTGVNAPGSFTNTVTLSPGMSSIDGGAITLTQTILPGPGKSEWIVLNFQTASGLIAGNLNADWSLAAENIPLVQTSVIEQFYVDWGTNGVLFSPTSEGGGNLPLETNPITGVGMVEGQAFSIVTNTAFGDAFADTFSGFLSAQGFTPSSLNQFQMGELVGPVPEPGSVALLISGLLGMALARSRERRTS